MSRPTIYNNDTKVKDLTVGELTDIIIESMFKAYSLKEKKLVKGKNEE